LKKNLIWHDAEGDSWWRARCHNDDYTYVVAKDNLTNHMLVLRKSSDLSEYKVVVAVPQNENLTDDDLVESAKTSAGIWLNEKKSPGLASALNKWRINRIARVFIKEVPILFLSFIMGSLLSFALSFFFVILGYSGWTMIACGMAVGVLCGSFLNWLSNRGSIETHESLARYLFIMLSAFLGSVSTVILIFLMFSV